MKIVALSESGRKCRLASRLLFAAICLSSFLCCRQEPALTDSAVMIPESGYERHWTTVVYMAADNDLEGSAIADVREMLAAGGLEAAGHTVLVLIDRAVGYDASAFNWTDTRLFRIEPADSPAAINDFSFLQIDCGPLGLTAGTETELNMAASGTLRKLLLFAQSEYPADDYALVVWGHGSGWHGYVVDEEAGDSMSLPELHDAVTGLDKSLSVIAFDCCYGSMLETAYELRDDADMLVASERTEPSGGWNYTFFFEQLAQWDFMDADTSAAEGYARCAVNAFARQYADEGGVSVTAVKLSEAESVFSAFDSFAASCAACLQTREAAAFFSSQIVSDSAVFLSGEYPAYAFVDIESLADSFLERNLPSCNPALMQAASQTAVSLKEALAVSTVVSFTGGSGVSAGLSVRPMLAVYLATMRAGGVVDAVYPQLYVRGNGTGGQCSFVRDSAGWVPQYLVSQSTSLLDHLYRMPLP